MIILNEGIYNKPTDDIKALVFLDHDGVMANEESFNNELMSDNYYQFNDTCLANLEYIIECTDAHVVITSSWRKRNLNWLHEVYKLRNFKYTERIIGETMRAYQFVEKGCQLPIGRGTEIKVWIEKFMDYEKGVGFIKKNIPYVIIDDDKDMLLSQKDNFVNTVSKYGLTRKDAEKAILILTR